MTSNVTIQYLSMSGRNVRYTLPDGTQDTRPLTERELRLRDAIGAVITEDLHGVYRKFVDQVLNVPAEPYERMLLAQQFVLENPEWTLSVTCDDSHHMTSFMVLIRHGSSQNYMGIRVVILTQTGETYDFFLYPGSLISLLKALLLLSPFSDMPAYVAEQHGLIAALRLNVPSGEYTAEDKPSLFDCLEDGYKKKSWYQEIGFTFEE